MESKKYGPKLRGNIYHNDYKKADNHPDYTQSGKWQVQVTDEFLRYLVNALRTEGVEPRIGVALWENQDNNGNTSFGVEVEAVSYKPKDEQEQQPQREPEPPSEPPPPVDAYDDIPF